MKPTFKILKSEKGYTIPELLLAAGIVLMISSIFLAGVKAFSEQRKKVNTTILALSLQDNVQNALKDPANFPKEMQQILKDGASEYENIVFKSTWAATEFEARKDLFTPGRHISFNLKKEALSIEDPQAAVQLYTEIRKINEPGISFPIYRLGYRIVFADKKIPHLGAPLAQGQRADVFKDSDFTETIPHELYMGKANSENQGLVQCDSNIDVGIHGFNRDTGAPICIEKIYGEVPPKSFPRSLGFVEGFYGENSLGIKPHLTLNYVPFRSFRPLPNYIFQRIDTRAFDPIGPMGIIKLVFIYKKNAPFYPGAPMTGMNTVTAKCPTKYYKPTNVGGACKIQGAPIPRAVKCLKEDPAPPGPLPPGYTPTYSESTCPPNCAASTTVTASVSGANVVCKYAQITCPNGGTYDANLTVNSSGNDCTLSVPENMVL